MRCWRFLLVFLISALALSVYVYAASWHTAEDWTFSLQTPVASYHAVETWSFYLYGTPAPQYKLVENWTFTLAPIASYQTAENWTWTLLSGSYVFVENWTWTLNATPAWRTTENWIWDIYATPYEEEVAAHYHFAHNVTIPVGAKTYFGSDWIQTFLVLGSNDIVVSSWYERGSSYNWLNFTSVGTFTSVHFYTSSMAAGWFLYNDVNYTLNENHPGHGSLDSSLGYWDLVWTGDVPSNFAVPFPTGAYNPTVVIVAYDENDTSIVADVSVWNSTDSYSGSTPLTVTVEGGTLFYVTASEHLTDYTFAYFYYHDEYGVLQNVTTTTINLTLTSDRTISVYYTYTPYQAFLLPIMFIIGMVGLGCMFVGPMLTISGFRKHEYRDSFVMGVIITATGFALFIAWLWSV